MSQLTIYLPDPLEAAVKKQAKRQKKSVSAYLADLVERSLKRDGWPPAFVSALGKWEGDFPVPDDPPPSDQGEW